MTIVNEEYRCDVCGNLVKVIEQGKGTLVCCGQDMRLITKEPTSEIDSKHVPVIEKTDKTTIVKVGQISHPMTKEHYIKWIEVNIDGAIYIVKLNPEDEPVAEFRAKGKKTIARCLCNIHGIWKSKVV